MHILSPGHSLQSIHWVLMEINSALHIWWEPSLSTDLTWGWMGAALQSPPGSLNPGHKQVMMSLSWGIENHLMPSYQLVTFCMFDKILVFIWIQISHPSVFNISACSRVDPDPLKCMCLNICYSLFLICGLFTSEAALSDMWADAHKAF